MLINLRNALMGGKRLPYDNEVEFLESTGTQYINTGIVWESVTTAKMEATVQYTQTSGRQIIGGASTAFYFGCNANRWEYAYRLYKGTVGTDITTVAKEITSEGMGFYINGNLAATVTQSASQEWWGSSAYVFGLNNGGSFILPSTARLYSLKIWIGDSLVFDGIPVRRGTTGYLYDRVSGKLFGNAGTGDFVLGQDVVPVEYIESRSNHTQMIDTGFYANQNTKALITFEKLGADGWLFGARNGSSSATDKFGIFAYQSPNGKISAQVGNTYIEPIVSGGLTNRKKTVEMSLADGVIVDGETIATFYESQKSQTFTSTYPMALFNMRVSGSGFNAGIYCRVYAYQIFENGLIVRSFHPIRVGTEGAMMDVLTRRIYRNAGTGAFSYGNDLKYPIPAE